MWASVYTVTLLLSALLCWVTPSVEAGRKCIDCTWSIKVSGADDACTKDDVSKLGLLTIDCGDDPCEIKRQTRLSDNKLSEITRGCHRIKRTGCTKNALAETCYQDCDTEYCNSNKALEPRDINAATSLSAWSAIGLTVVAVAMQYMSA